MREFQKEWLKQVDENREEAFLATARTANFIKLWKAFQKDRPVRLLEQSRVADQKRWWWER